MGLPARALRRAAAVPVAACLLLGAVACSGSSGSDDAKGAQDGDGQTTKAAPAAPPGKYKLLPEPCGAVSQSTLDQILPGAASGPDSNSSPPSPDPSASPGQPPKKAGKPTLTFDTDRRTGCDWSVKRNTSVRSLHVDFERVVSYDNKVSDEQEAADDFLQTASKAEGPGDGTTHVVDGIGDEAFAQESAVTGTSKPHREVTLVFRNANVMTTVTYQVRPQGTGSLPSSETVQSAVRLVSGDLVKRLSEQ
jgi:hypothetical protein